jgi:hypothetical protein
MALLLNPNLRPTDDTYYKLYSTSNFKINVHFITLPISIYRMLL